MADPAKVPPIAVSIGDPSGIGPDIILQAWQKRAENRLPPFFVIGKAGILEARSKAMGIQSQILTCSADAPAASDRDHLSVLNTENPMAGVAGKPEKSDAKATLEAIETGVRLVMEKKASGLCTCPITKSVLYSAGFSHPGHTEYLAALAEKHTNTLATPVMMIAGPKIRTVPVTIHIPVSKICETLSADQIITTSRIVVEDLKTRFGIRNPRLAIAGLNPHAGEAGTMGREDIEIIAPAIETLASEGIRVTGPLPADTMFHDRARQHYDVAICMYHDQALIPAKTLGFDDSVNVTLGLPFVRTSPDHGTAHDIAGSGKASPQSFIAALNMAWQMATLKQA